jgi:hypothetical protein
MEEYMAPFAPEISSAYTESHLPSVQSAMSSNPDKSAFMITSESVENIGTHNEAPCALVHAPLFFRV